MNLIRLLMLTRTLIFEMLIEASIPGEMLNIYLCKILIQFVTVFHNAPGIFMAALIYPYENCNI